MKDVSFSRGASDLPVHVRVVGFLADFIAFGQFQARLLADNLDVDCHSELSHGSYDVQIAEFSHSLGVGLSSYSEIGNGGRPDSPLCYAA